VHEPDRVVCHRVEPLLGRGFSRHMYARPGPDVLVSPFSFSMRLTHSEHGLWYGRSKRSLSSGHVRPLRLRRSSLQIESLKSTYRIRTLLLLENLHTLRRSAPVSNYGAYRSIERPFHYIRVNPTTHSTRPSSTAVRTTCQCVCAAILLTGAGKSCKTAPGGQVKSAWPACGMHRLSPASGSGQVDCRHHGFRRRRHYVDNRLNLR